MLSYRSETTLQGALVLAKSGKLELRDNTLLWTLSIFSTSDINRFAKLSNLVEKTQNKGYYAVQGNSRSSRSVPIESPYATFLLVINSN